MDPAVLSALVIALGSLVVAILTTRQNRAGARATNALTARVVDREDFNSVMERMETALRRADARITELEDKLEAEVEARKGADTRAEAAERRAEDAEKRALKLERRVAMLEEILRQNDIPVPSVPPD